MLQLLQERALIAVFRGLFLIVLHHTSDFSSRESKRQPLQVIVYKYSVILKETEMDFQRVFSCFIARMVYGTSSAQSWEYTISVLHTVASKPLSVHNRSLCSVHIDRIRVFHLSFPGVKPCLHVLNVIFDKNHSCFSVLIPIA